jgi:NAD(P)-dependent dehydrogenase (short-subunit alcohol dehydrogenase family)
MIDLTGRVCVVTGATRGIGRATAEALAKMGATVVLHGRDAAAVGAVSRKIANSTGNANVSGVVADFASLADVRRLANEIAARHEHIDVLVNNAGTAVNRRRSTTDGFEWQFGVNHLAPFLLTNLLLERLSVSAPARVVTVASRAHKRGVIDFDDLHWERRNYDGLQVYSATKLANILFTRELARRLAGTDATANCLHPGVVATHIFSHMGLFGKVFGALSKPLLLPPEKGAETTVYLATSPEVATVSGKYFDKCKAVEPAPTASDDAVARRLWDVSENLTAS